MSLSRGSTAGGETATITRTGFVSGGTTVKLGRIKARSVNCTSWDVANPAVETTCTATSPAHTAETVNVRATVNETTSPNTTAEEYTYG